MKLTSILSAFALAALAGSAVAQTTINITGATAFRQGAIQTIKTTFAGGLVDLAYTGTVAINGEELAAQSIFRGNYPGITGTTVIRATWSGSVEGIRDVATNQNTNFLTTGAFALGSNSPGGTNPASTLNKGAVPAGTDPAIPRFAFSDVAASTSPFNVSSVTSTPVGVLPFFAVINESGAAVTDITNMQSDKFGQLASVGTKTAAYMFGSTDTRPVYVTGRNDLSGTRSTYLALSRGPTDVLTGDVAAIVQQWRPTVASGAITVLRLWPTLAQGATANEVSSVWTNVDTAGNGGFNSGGTVATALGATSSGVSLRGPTNNIISASANVLLVSVVGLSDTRTARAAGAKILAWNGVLPNPNVSGNLDATTVGQISDGSYTCWSYEQLVAKNGLTADEITFQTALLGSLDSSLGSAGIPLSSVVAFRNGDGTYVLGGD